MAKYEVEKFDSCLNTFREIYSNPVVDKYQGTVILPLDFSLEMDGISGFGFKRIASEAWHWEYQTT